MDFEAEIKTIKAQPTVTIRKTIAQVDIVATMDEMLPAVWTYLESKKIHPAGPPFVRYHTFESNEVDMEGGFPVNEVIETEGWIKASELPAGEVATTIHWGHYNKLTETYAKLGEWSKEQGYEDAGSPWEIYLTDPSEVGDESKWQTQVVWPVKKQ